MIDEIKDIDEKRISTLSGTIHDRHQKLETSKTKRRGRKRLFTELWSKESGFKEAFLDFLQNDTQLKQSTLKNYKIFLYRNRNDDKVL